MAALISVSSGPGCETSIQPSAPIPVCRSQIALAASLRPSMGASLIHVSRKSFPAPCALVNGILILVEQPRRVDPLVRGWPAVPPVNLHRSRPLHDDDLM